MGEIAAAHQQGCGATFRRSVALCEDRCFSPARRLRGHPAHGGYRLLRRLRRLGRITLLDPPLWSSPRRFRRLGNARTLLINTSLIALFYLGVSPQTLHRWYYARRYDAARLCGSAARELSFGMTTGSDGAAGPSSSLAKTLLACRPIWSNVGLHRPVKGSPPSLPVRAT